MNYKILSTLLAGGILVLSGCATTPSATNAIMLANNQYEVTGIGKSNLIAKIMLWLLQIKPVRVAHQ